MGKKMAPGSTMKKSRLKMKVLFKFKTLNLLSSGAFKNAYYEFDTSTHSRKNIDNRQYDRIFNADCNYDPKLHRDDRSNAKSR